MHAADEIASAARHLLAQAVAAGGAGVPCVPEPGPGLPATAVQPGSLLSPLPLGEAGRRPGEGAVAAPQIAGTLTPALSQRETSGVRGADRHTETTAAAPATDVSGIRSFVRRIRGLDHLRPPPLFDPTSLGVGGAGSQPAALAGRAFSGGFDVVAVRRDFPILAQRVHGKPLAWFDNAATTQKPQVVIDALAHFYAHDNSNIHRGAHTLAA